MSARPKSHDNLGKIIDWLATYKSLGFSEIPVGLDKKPTLLIWKPFMARRPTEEELKGWFSGAVVHGLAVVCGNVSRVVVLDFESFRAYVQFFPDQAKIEAETLVEKTPHDGVHVYLRPTGDMPGRKIKICENPAIDLLGEGGYCVAAPSVIDHSLCDKTKCQRQGFGSYELISPHPRLLEVSDIEASVVRRCAELGWKLKSHRSMKEITQGVGRGERNESAFRYSRYLLHFVRLEPGVAFSELERVNAKFRPPLGSRELRCVFESAKKYPWESATEQRVKLRGGRAW